MSAQFIRCLFLNLILFLILGLLLMLVLTHSPCPFQDSTTCTYFQ